uniref:Uncharacterized protein n=1 Tax=Glossina pallidipes TaxID=7398 RepID=A0A1B0ADE9_GLOPL
MNSPDIKKKIFNLFPFEFAIPPFEFAIPPFDFVIPPFEFAIPPFEFAIPPFDFVIPPFEFAIPPFEFAIPPFEFAILLFDFAIPLFEFAIPPFECAIPPFDFAIPPFEFLQAILNRSLRETDGTFDLKTTRIFKLVRCIQFKATLMELTDVSNKRARNFSRSFKLLMSSCTEPVIHGKLEQLVLSHLKASQKESNRKVIDNAIAMTSTSNITDI